MSDEPTVERIDDDAVDVATTLAAYDADPEHYIQKFRRQATADRFGEQFVASLPDRTGPRRVLDVGCGPGADVAAFTDRGFDVVGIDASGRLLRAAADDVEGGRFVRGDMRTLPFADSAFDGLWSSASLLHLARKDVPATLEEFARVLAPDGALFVSVVARESTPAGAVESADGRRFTFWREEALLARLEAAGFDPAWVSDQDDWHALVAIRGGAGAAGGRRE